MDRDESDRRKLRFRYRTATLVGPWRDSIADAVEDAIRAGQAAPDEAQGLRWLVPGRIDCSTVPR